MSHMSTARGAPCAPISRRPGRYVAEACSSYAKTARRSQYLVGGALTEADIRVFVTLVRFDLAYHGLFKCNVRRVADYLNLAAYVRRLLAVPAFREATNEEHIKRGYYSIAALNPNGIVPIGPVDPFGLAAEGERLADVAAVERGRAGRV